MDDDQLFEMQYHDEMEMLAELENGKIHSGYRTTVRTVKTVP